MTRNRLALIGIVILAAAVLMLLHRRGDRRDAPRIARISELTEPEFRYGLAPTPDSSVTYQPDVVIVKGGANIIRSAGGDGLTWTLDPEAPGVERLLPGKIMLVTGRAVGRVVLVRATDEGLAVTVAPVEFNEIVRNADIHLDLPLDLGEAIVYILPDYPGASMEVTQPSAGWRPTQGSLAPGVLPAGFFASAGPTSPRPQPRPTTGSAPATAAFGFITSPVVSANGIGIRATADVNGVRFVGEASFDVKTPRLRGIVSGTDVYLRLEGAAGVRMQFEAAGAPNRTNIDQTLPLPYDWSLPILGTGVPLSVTVQQALVIKTAFSSTGNLKASGGFGLDGAFELGYKGGKFELLGPGFTAYDSFLKGTQGLSLGPAGLVLVHQVRVMVGLGVAGFATGPYVGLRTSVGVANGSAIGIVGCKDASLYVNLVGGVGYSLPTVVVEAVNAVFKLFGIRMRINRTGGANIGDKRIYSREESSSNSKICKAG